MTGAMYLTVAIDADERRAAARLDAYLEHYYDMPAATMRATQMCYGGPAAGLSALIRAYADAGVNHLIVRCAGDHERHIDTLATIHRA